MRPDADEHGAFNVEGMECFQPILDHQYPWSALEFQQANEL